MRDTACSTDGTGTGRPRPHFACWRDANGPARLVFRMGLDELRERVVDELSHESLLGQMDEMWERFLAVDHVTGTYETAAGRPRPQRAGDRRGAGAEHGDREEPLREGAGEAGRAEPGGRGGTRDPAWPDRLADGLQPAPAPARTLAQGVGELHGGGAERLLWREQRRRTGPQPDAAVRAALRRRDRGRVVDGEMAGGA
jgi:hypothetical protein